MTLLSTIDQTITATPSLWWLGKAGFVVRFAEAARLASAIGATWLAPYGNAQPSVVEHLLGHCPEQRFKAFQLGEGWTVPED